MSLKPSFTTRIFPRLFTQSLLLTAVLAVGTFTPALAQSLVVAPSIKLLAGTGTSGSGSGQLGMPLAMTSDPSGNLYVADATNDVIWLVPAGGGAAQVYAGKLGVAGYTGDGGAATSATLSAPGGVLYQGGGILISDTGNNVVRQVMNGAIQTVAGPSTGLIHVALNGPRSLIASGSFIYIVDTGNRQVWRVVASSSPSANVIAGGSATPTQLSQPIGLAADASGNLYIGDAGANVVYTLKSGASDLAVYAGTGTAGFSGDGGSPLSAKLSAPTGLAFDASGNLYIADTNNNRIREVLAGGSQILTVAGTGTAGFNASPTGGLAINAQFTHPQGLLVDALGKLDIADSGNGSVWSLNSSGGFGTTAVGSTASQTVTLQALSALTLASTNAATIPPGFNDYSVTSSTCSGALASGATCSVALQFAPLAPGQRTAPLTVTTVAGASYVFGLRGNGSGPAATLLPGVLSTAAGTGTSGYGGDNQSAAKATLAGPAGVAWDGAGNLFLADTGNHLVRVINNQASAITVAGVSIPAGAIATVAGTANISGYAGDGGAATSAKLHSPQGVWVDYAENIYIADTGNNVVRLVNGATGTISTVAGTGTAGSSGDGGVGLSAQLSGPIGLAGDNHGNLYIADTGNSAVRLLASGFVSTVAGQLGQSGYSNDGGSATHGNLSHPQGITLDGVGNLYIADTGNNVVRVVNLGATSESLLGNTLNAGVITTAAGGGSGTLASDAGSAQAPTTVGFKALAGVAADAAGNVYIADTGDNRIAVLEIGSDTLIPVAGGAGGVTFKAAADSAYAVSLSGPTALAVLGGGGLAIADTGDSAIRVVSTAAGQADMGATLPRGPALSLNAGLLNSGTSALAVNGLAAATSTPAGAADFSLGTSTATNPCQSNSSLSAGLGCSFLATFLPSALVAEKGSIAITDTALNATAAVQTMALNGTGISGVGTAHTLIVFTASPSSVEVGGTSTFSAEVLDYLNNPVAGVTVTASVPSGLMVAPAGGSATTGSNGVATFTLTATAAGSYTVTVSAAGVSTTGTARLTVGAVLAATSYMAVGSSGRYATVGSTVTTPMGVQLIEAQAGTAGNYNVGAGVPITFSATSGLTFANGTGTITVSTDSTGTAYVGAVKATGPPGSYTLTLSTTLFTVGNPTLYTVLEEEPPVSAPATLFSPTAVGSSSTATYTYTVPAAMAATFDIVGKVVALTAGQASLDFSAQAGTTNGCSGTYAANATCTVSITFTPTAPGLRQGVVELQTSFGLALADIFVSGTGTAPVAGYGVSTQSTATINTSGALNGLFADGNGNLFFTVSSPSFSTAYKTTLAAPTSLSSINTVILQNPTGVAIDGGGDLFIADAAHSYVVELANYYVNPYPALVGSGWSNPAGLAVDGAGNLYVADSGLGQVMEVTAAGVQSALTLTGLKLPDALALDANQNLYIADGAGAIYRYNLTTKVQTQLAASTAWVEPAGIAVDAAGDVYVADNGLTPGSQIYEIAGSTVTNLGLATTLPRGLAIDGLGNLVVADNAGGPKLVIAALGTPGTYKFIPPDATTGSTQTASTPLYNLGNATLNVSGLAVTTGSSVFSVDSGSGACAVGSTVAAAGSCALTLKMAPAAPASATGVLTVTDNSNNKTAATQTLSLNGTGAGVPVNLAISGTPALSQTIGAVVTGPLAVLVTDTLGNPVQGAQIAFTITQGAGGASGFYASSGNAATALSNSSGVATLGSTLTANGTVGAWTVVASVVSNPAVTATFNLSNSPAAASVLLVTASTTTPAAGTPITVTVTASDGFGHTVTNFADTVALTSSDGQAVLPANSALSSGVGTFPVTLTTSGNQTIMATDTAKSGITGAATVNVAAGAITQLALSVPGGTVVNGELTTSGTSGQAIIIHAMAEDVYGNVNTSATDAVSFNSGDGQSNSGTMGAGVALLPYTPTIPSTPAFPLTLVRVTDSTRNLTASFVIAIAPGPATQLVQSTVPAAVTINSTFSPLTMHVYDYRDDPVPGASVSFSIPLAGTNATPTFSNGSTSITLTTDANGQASPAINAGAHAGTFLVNITLNGNVASAQATLQVLPGAQTITFPAIPAQQYGAAPYLLNATSSSGQPVQYTVVTGPATISPVSGQYYLTTTGTGAVTVQASAPASADYLAATPVQQSFQVLSPAAQVSPSSLTFGSVAVGSNTAQSVGVGNPGTLALTISSITSTTADFAPSQNCVGAAAAVPGGGSCTIQVTFAPTGAGTRAGTLTITDNAGNSPQQVQLTGTGTAPGVALSPNFLDFGGQTMNTTSSARAVNISDTGTAPLTITAVNLTGPYALVSGSSCSIVQPGTTCSLGLTFTPTNQGVVDTGTLAITDSIGTQTVYLQGVGSSSGLTVTPSAVTFLPLLGGQTSLPQQVTVAYLGGTALTHITIAPQEGFSATTQNCAFPLNQAGQTCTLAVYFSPSSASPAGTISADLQLVDDQGGQLLSVTGAVLQPGPTVSPAQLVFGSQNLGGTSAAQTVTLTNSGSTPITVGAIASNGYTLNNECQTSLAAGGQCLLNVSFAPTIAGPASGTLNISTGSGGIAVGLAGLGVQGIAVAPSLLNFGSATVGSATQDETVYVTNTGTVAYNLNGFTTSGDFAISVNQCSGVLNAGSTCQIFLVYAPTTVNANASGSLSISDSNGAYNATVALAGQGTAPGITAAPAQVSFGSAPVGASTSPLTVTVTNNGTGALSIQGLNLIGDFAVGNTTCLGSNGAATTLASGAYCIVNVVMTPTSVGSRSGALQILNNADGNFAVALTGNGQGAGVSLYPTYLDFGSTPAGNSLISLTGPTQAISLVNTGNSSLTVTSVTAQPGFTQTNTCLAAPIAAGGSCTVTVGFSPTATGEWNGLLTIADNSTTSPLQVVTLRGLGSPNGLSMSPSTISFGGTTVGQTSAPVTVTLSNATGQTIQSLTVTPSGEFAVPSNTCTASVPSPGTCTFNVTVTPLTQGAYTGSISVTGSLAAVGQVLDGGDGSEAAARRTELVASSSGLAAVAMTGTGDTPGMNVSKSGLTFAAQAVGTSSAGQTLVITNASPASALTGLTVASSAPDFVVTNPCGTSIAASGTCTLTIAFSPKAPGARTGNLTVSAAGGFQAAVALAGTGTGVSLGANPSTASFGAAAEGTPSAPLTVTVSATGSGTVTLQSYAVSNPDFAVSSSTCGTLPATLTAPSTCAFTMVFTPSGTTTESATLTINSNATNGNVVVPLSGAGGSAGLALAPLTLSFGTHGVGSSAAAQAVKLTNSGTSALAISTIQTSGDYSQTNNCGAALAAGVSCNVQVTFSPTATGSRAGVLSVVNAVATQNIPLSGLGSDFSITYSGAASTTGAGQTTLYTLQFASTSGDTQTLTLACTPQLEFTCAMNPGSVSVGSGTNATATLTLTDQGINGLVVQGASGLPGGFFGNGGGGWLMACTGLLFGLATFLGRRRRGWLAGLALAGAVAFGAGCGTSGPQAGVATSVTVTATSSLGNSHAVTVQLMSK